jgi:hypothetical protein
LGGESPRPDRAGAWAWNFRVHSTFPPACGGKGEEAVSGDEKPEPFKRKGMIDVKPRQESQKTERREDIKRRINDELEFLTEMEDKIPRKEEKRDYEIEQLLEEAVDEAMAELRRALPPEELEIYEKCYKFFKRSNSTAIRCYTSERIPQRSLNLRGEE